MDAVGAERLDTERGGERGVDPARDADHDVAEAVLRHVVVQPELEREAHLLELVELRSERRMGGLGLLARGRELDLGELGRRAVACERAAANVAQAPSDGCDRVDVDDQQLLLEAGGAREHRRLRRR